MTLKRRGHTTKGGRTSLLFGKLRMRIRTYGIVRGLVETPPYSIIWGLFYSFKLYVAQNGRSSSAPSTVLEGAPYILGSLGC